MGKTAGKIQHVPFILPQKLRKVLTKVVGGAGAGTRHNIVSLIHSAFAYNPLLLGKIHRKKRWEMSNNK